MLQMAQNRLFGFFYEKKETAELLGGGGECCMDCILVNTA